MESDFVSKKYEPTETQQAVAVGQGLPASIDTRRRPVPAGAGRLGLPPEVYLSGSLVLTTGGWYW
jgi:hypothetical protein